MRQSGRRDSREYHGYPVDGLASRALGYMRAGIAMVALTTLAACGGGSGEGLDQSGQPLPPGGGTPLAPTLASIQDNVFSVNCVGCHTGGGAPFGLSLESADLSYTNLINVVSPRDPNPSNPTYVRVRPNNPNDSFLIQKLEGTQTLGARMPLPPGTPPLPQATIDVIRQWIQNGAPR
jgi:hypothetical protein